MEYRHYYEHEERLVAGDPCLTPGDEVLVTIKERKRLKVGEA